MRVAARAAVVIVLASAAGLAVAQVGPSPRDAPSGRSDTRQEGVPLGAATATARGGPGGEDDGERGDALVPGLLATYRPAAATAEGPTFTRIDAKPAFALGDSSPHPRIPPGPFEATWTGTLDLLADDSLRFGGYLGGTVTVTLGGVPVLEGRRENATAWLESGTRRAWSRGTYPLRIVYRSLPGVPARIQLWWEGASFSREPLPAWRLKHQAAGAPEPFTRDERAARGRTEVERLGCARCHRAAFPAVDGPPPGPSLARVGRRLNRDWLLDWLGDPAQVRHQARMPALFAPDRQGFVERSIVADVLLEAEAKAEGDVEARPEAPAKGNVRAGRKVFLSLGCFACHPTPGEPEAGRAPTGRTPLAGLGDRFSEGDLAGFLQSPQTRYPDGRMPRLPVEGPAARDLSAFLLAGAASTPRVPVSGPVTPHEVETVARRLGVSGVQAAGRALLREKRCAQCHPGLGESVPDAVPIGTGAAGTEGRGCLGPKAAARYALANETRQAVVAYLALAAQERHPSPFETRQQLLRRYGCVQCHQRDTESLAPIEEAGSQVTDHDLLYLAGQRTPKLTNVLSKETRAYVRSAIRDGTSGARSSSYSYRMPGYGGETESIVKALAEGDGDLLTEPEPSPPPIRDPELAAQGPNLAGSAGYSCVACHLWKGRNLTAPEPGAAGPELTTVTRRIRRDYFDRWLDEPSRIHPRTPMPQIFRKGSPAMLTAILDGDVNRQKDALWAYFSLGDRAPDPTSLPPTPLPDPSPGGPPLIAQVPIHLPDQAVVESVCVLFGSHDALVYDIGRAAPRGLYTGARLLRVPRDRRSFALQGERVEQSLADTTFQLVGPDGRQSPTSAEFLGYDRLRDGLRVRTRVRFESGPVEVAETFRLARGGPRQLLREVRVEGLPPGARVELRGRVPESGNAPAEKPEDPAPRGTLFARLDGESATRSAVGTVRSDLPPAHAPPAPARPAVAPASLAVAPGTIDGETEQPGYRALAYPRPRTSFGEDLIMPGAIVASPHDGRVYIASMKMGEVFALDDPRDDGTGARFVDYCGGRFQDAYAMTHDGDSLYLLHRRNLTRIRDTDGDGFADRFDRIVALQHSVTENVDNAYGLVRDSSGAFVFTYAVNTSQKLPGWGAVLKLTPGKTPVLEELAFGMRRAYGWSLGPGGEVFFTDNQGEWVATNRVCHVDPGRYFGYPNPGQEHHLTSGFALFAMGE